MTLIASGSPLKVAPASSTPSICLALNQRRLTNVFFSNEYLAPKK